MNKLLILNKFISIEQNWLKLLYFSKIVGKVNLKCQNLEN